MVRSRSLSSRRDRRSSKHLCSPAVHRDAKLDASRHCQHGVLMRGHCVAKPAVVGDVHQKVGIGHVFAHEVRNDGFVANRGVETKSGPIVLGLYFKGDCRLPWE